MHRMQSHIHSNNPKKKERNNLVPTTSNLPTTSTEITQTGETEKTVSRSDLWYNNWRFACQLCGHFWKIFEVQSEE